MTEHPGLSHGAWRDAASFAEAVFMAHDALGSLAPRPSVPATVVTFHDIYRYAVDPVARPRAALLLALAADGRVRDDLRRVLARTAPMRTQSRAAASTGAITTRDGVGFRMTLRESRADRGQIYLTIRLGSAAAPAPATLFVISDRKGCRKVALPAPVDGVIQLLLDVTSDLAGALCDPQTDVFLR